MSQKHYRERRARTWPIRREYRRRMSQLRLENVAERSSLYKEYRARLDEIQRSYSTKIASLESELLNALDEVELEVGA